jgi:hypothetical protein
MPSISALTACQRERRPPSRQLDMVSPSTHTPQPLTALPFILLSDIAVISIVRYNEIDVELKTQVEPGSSLSLSGRDFFQTRLLRVPPIQYAFLAERSW